MKHKVRLTMKDITMKRLLVLMTICGGMQYAQASVPPFPVHVKGPSLMQAIEDSDSQSLKQQLIIKQELPRNEKEYLLKRAKAIAQERRRNVSLFKSPWDLGRFLIGSFLTFNFMFDFDTIGDAAKYLKVKKDLKEMQTPEKKFNVPAGSNIATVLDDKHKITKDYRATLKKQIKDKTIKVDDQKKYDEYKVDVKSYKEYASKYNDLEAEDTILSARNFLDKSVFGFLGIYWMIRGFFCVTATKSFMKAQRIVEILERVPVVEDRDPA